MSIRDNLLEQYRTNPHLNDNYTYEECLQLIKAGHTISDEWLGQAWERERRSKAAQELDEQIAADRERMAKDRAQAEKDHRAAFDTRMEGKVEALDTAKQDLVPLRKALQDARTAYNNGAATANGQRKEIKRVVREYFPDKPNKDFDGNPLPGQTYVDDMGFVYIDGQRIN